MGKSVSISKMAETIMEGLTEYASVSTDTLKAAARTAATTAKKEIQANAPVDTGGYKKSWTTKKTAETSNSISYTVYSKNRYQIAHLLENGHAKKGGGRVSARPHIAPAAETAEEQFVSKLKSNL